MIKPILLSLMVLTGAKNLKAFNRDTIPPTQTHELSKFDIQKNLSPITKIKRDTVEGIPQFVLNEFKNIHSDLDSIENLIFQNFALKRKVFPRRKKEKLVSPKRNKDLQIYRIDQFRTDSKFGVESKYTVKHKGKEYTFTYRYSDFEADTLEIIELSAPQSFRLTDNIFYRYNNQTGRLDMYFTDAQGKEQRLMGNIGNENIYYEIPDNKGMYNPLPNPFYLKEVNSDNE